MPNDFTPEGAKAFIKSTRDNGGASMFLHNGRMPDVGNEKLYVVGKEPSQRTGKSVPTVHENVATGNSVSPVNRVISHKQFAAHFARLKAEATRPDGTVHPKAMIGSWIDDKSPVKGVQMDLSAGYKTRKTAVRKGKERGEDAVFDVKHVKDIRLK